MNSTSNHHNVARIDVQESVKHEGMTSPYQIMRITYDDGSEHEIIFFYAPGALPLVPTTSKDPTAYPSDFVRGGA